MQEDFNRWCIQTLTWRGGKGISLHAPYSAHKKFLVWPGGFHIISVAVHLAETQEELHLLDHHAGPFRRFLEELGAWNEDALVDSLESILQSCRTAPHTLIIHGNYLPPDTDLGQATLVYCPRTHAAFQHPPHPFREFLKRGHKVALGTDSLASNPDLDILGEARFVHRLHPDLPGAILLRMITQTPAAALKRGKNTGTLTPGKSADLCLLEGSPGQPADPYEQIFAIDRPALATVFRGDLVFSRDPGLVWGSGEGANDSCPS